MRTVRLVAPTLPKSVTRFVAVRPSVDDIPVSGVTKRLVGELGTARMICQVSFVLPEPELPARSRIPAAFTVNECGIWTNIKPFKWNNLLYSLCTPALTPDGERIYFSSDMPGGLGG